MVCRRPNVTTAADKDAFKARPYPFAPTFQNFNPMRFIPSSVHGVLDYVVGLFLITAPWVLGFADLSIPATVIIAVGAINLVYSLLTNYELGILRILSMPLHLWLDFISGALLAVSPWLLRFSKKVYLPHLLLGLLEMSASLLSKRRPGRPLPLLSF